MIFNIIDNNQHHFPFGFCVISGNMIILEQYLLNTYGKEYIGYINTSGTWFKIGRYIWFNNQTDRDVVISKFRKKKI
jgi:hypothetical protein